MTHDPINSPAHYTKGNVEAIDQIEEIVRHYPNPVIGGCIWQTIKYLIRAPHKGDFLGDLLKAEWYLKRAISHECGVPAKNISIE